MTPGKLDLLTIIPTSEIETKGIPYVKSLLKSKNVGAWNTFWNYFTKTWMKTYGKNKNDTKNKKKAKILKIFFPNLKLT